ncbi:MAG: Uma2 family endonuclease, partial [Anaerolineae bacterium]|nr:Uma2 family endonuclease [Anaerolineae bacterium]
EFEALVDEDLKAEYLDGAMIVHSPASFLHEDRQAFLLTLLRWYVEARAPRKKVVGGNALFRAGSRQFAPDVMVIPEEAVTARRVEGIPILAIEVLSESTRDYDLGEKRAAYREVGIPEIWWVDLERQTVIVERRDRSYQAEAVPEGWVVSEVVPGFRIRAEWLWQEPLPSVVQCWEALRSLKSGG